MAYCGWGAGTKRYRVPCTACRKVEDQGLIPSATPTIPALGPGSKRPRLRALPAAATVLWRTAAASRGPLPSRLAPGHRVPRESTVASGLREAQAALGRAA